MSACGTEQGNNGSISTNGPSPNGDSSTNTASGTNDATNGQNGSTVCDPGSVKCADASTVVRCSDDGATFIPAEECTDTEACIDGECLPQDVDRVSGYVRSDVYSRLVIEVDYVAGQAPTPEVAEQLENGLSDLLDKPTGIEVVLDEELDPYGDDHAWDYATFAQLERETYDLEVSDETIKMHVLFVDGHDARDDEDTSILGVSWSNRNVILYLQKIRALCESELADVGRGREQACDQAELAIWTHEIGHVIGLVSNGLPMVDDHEDPEHPHHDVNEECVMYWAYEGRQAFDKVGQRFTEDQDIPALGLDDACLADLAAVRDAD
jgi:hypothetical protein